MASSGMLISIAAIAFVIAFTGLMILLSMRDAQTKTKWAAGAMPDSLDWEVLLSAEIQVCLPDKKIEAIKRYRQQTGVGLKEAKDAIDYFSEHRGDVPAKLRRYDLVDEQAEGIRDLLREGKRAEAQKIYQAFTGIDQFTASEALDALEEEVRTEVERYDEQITGNRLSEQKG